MAIKRIGVGKNPALRIKDLFKTWPLTVWPLDYTNDAAKRFKREVVMDDGSAREQSGTAGYKTSLGSSINQVSIFNPELIGYILNFWPPPEGGTIYDPFGGGGTRAIGCAGEGYNYVGVEIRLEEVNAVNARVAKLDEKWGTNIAENITLVHGDAMAPGLPDEMADMLITCPPYYDLEKYGGGEKDLSMAGDYGTFVNMLGQVIDEAERILKPGALSCWVVGLHRDKTGELLPLHHDIGLLHYDRGFKFREEIIIHMQNTGSIQRVGNFAKGQNLLIRVHEYCLIFQKPVVEG